MKGRVHKKKLRSYAVISCSSVGDGDTTLSFDPKKPEETRRAKKIADDMLKRGFAILVEVRKNDGEPLYQHAKTFDGETAEYIIVGAPEDDEEDHEEAAPAPEPARPRRKAGAKCRPRKRRVKVDVANAAADEWADIPMPLEGQPLSIAPGYPFAEALAMLEKPVEPDPDMEGVRLINRFWSRKFRRDISIVEKDGRRMIALNPYNRRFDMDLLTLGCASAWGIEQEAAAVHTLGRLVKHHAFGRWGAVVQIHSLRPLISST